MSAREATVKRKTTETEVLLTLRLEGTGNHSIDTGIGFLDHMLALVAVHGLFDLDVSAEGDRRVDDHHTVEDVGIALGRAISDAIAGGEGIRRYGTCIAPMDEALGLFALDLSGRAVCSFDAPLTGKIGTFDAELVGEFFAGLSRGGALTLHARILAGRNQHHMAEALFKAFGRALDEAVELDPRRKNVPSSKGSLR